MTSCFNAYPEAGPLRLAERAWRWHGCGGWRAATPCLGGGAAAAAGRTDQDRPESEAAERTQLQAARAELVLPDASTPIQLQLKPAPSRPAVFW